MQSFQICVILCVVAAVMPGCDSSVPPGQYVTTVTTVSPGFSQDIYGVYANSSSSVTVVGDSGLVLKSTNAGGTWTNVSFATDNPLFGVFFFNDSSGYACGSLLVLATSNSGTTWAKRDSTGYYDYVTFFDNNNGVVTGSRPDFNATLPFARRTTNAGGSWTEVSILSLTKYIVLTSDGSFYNSTHGMIVAEFPGLFPINEGSAFRTTDGGTTWDSIYNFPPYLRGVHCISTSIAYVCGDSGFVMMTTNFGNSWQTQSSGVTARLHSVHFTSPSIGYIVGEGGTILKTTNGGSTWTALSSGTTEHLYDVYFPTPTVGYVVGAHGTILKISER